MTTRLEVLLEMKRQLDETIAKIEDAHKNPKKLSKYITMSVDGELSCLDVLVYNFPCSYVSRHHVLEFDVIDEVQIDS